MLKVGMGSRACSKNSRIVGVMIVSSGMLWRLIQAEKNIVLSFYSVLFFENSACKIFTF